MIQVLNNSMLFLNIKVRWGGRDLVKSYSFQNAHIILACETFRFVMDHRTAHVKRGPGNIFARPNQIPSGSPTLPHSSSDPPPPSSPCTSTSSVCRHQNHHFTWPVELTISS